MSDRATIEVEIRVTRSQDQRSAYEPNWYASLLAFSPSDRGADDFRDSDHHRSVG